MKIAFIIQDLFQLGAQYVTALMVRGFIAKGYDVDLIVSKLHQDKLDEGILIPFEIPQSTNVIILPQRKARNNVKAICRYLKDSTPDAIVAMSSNYNLSLALAVLKLPKRIKDKFKVAYVEHSSLVGFDKNMNRQNPPSLFSKDWAIAKLYKHVFDVIMAVSNGTASSLEKSIRLKEGSVIPVYNPVIDNIYWNKLESHAQHPWLKSKTVPTFVAAAAHSRFKNHLCLFEAIKLVNKRTPVKLVLFGRGELTEMYQKWIKDNGVSHCINLAGQTPNLPAEIKEADGFLISSNVESFSVVLVEALAAGTPVISTACPFGPPEILQNGKYGTLVPVNDPQALADAIVAQIRNPRKAAPKEAWEPYTLENVVKAYEKALGFFSVNNHTKID